MIRLKSDEPAPVVGLQLMVVISLEEAIEDFVIDRQSRRLSPRTLSYYRDELGLFSRWMEAPHPAAGNAGQQIALDGVRATEHRRWLLDLSERRNPGGVHASFRALRAFFGWAWVEYEYTTHNPMAKVAPPRVPEQLLEPVDMATVRVLLETCDRSYLGKRDRAMIMGLLDTGCRAAEFVALNVEDVDVRSGRVRVRSGKGGQERVVFFGQQTRMVLRRYLRLRPEKRDDDPLWVHEQAFVRRLRYSGLRAVIRSRAKRAGVPAPTLHSFRRGFAIESLRNGANIYALQRLTGHKSLDVLRRYLKLAEHDLGEEHRRTAPVDNTL